MAVLVWRRQQDVGQIQISMDDAIVAWGGARRRRRRAARMKEVGTVSTVTQRISHAVKHMPYKGLGHNKAVRRRRSVSRRVFIYENRIFFVVTFVGCGGGGGVDTFCDGTKATASSNPHIRHTRSRYETVL